MPCLRLRRQRQELEGFPLLWALAQYPTRAQQRLEEKRTASEKAAAEKAVRDSSPSQPSRAASAVAEVVRKFGVGDIVRVSVSKQKKMFDGQEAEVLAVYRDMARVMFKTGPEIGTEKRLQLKSFTILQADRCHWTVEIRSVSGAGLGGGGGWGVTT